MLKFSDHFFNVHWLNESWLIWSYQTSRNVHFNIRNPVSNGIVTAVRRNADIGWAEFRLGGLSLGLLLSFCYTNENSLLLIIFQQITTHLCSLEITELCAVDDLDCGIFIDRTDVLSKEKLDVLVLQL